MEIRQLESMIEAILFGVGEAVSLQEIAKATETDEETVRRVVNLLSDKYDADKRGIKIIQLESSYQMCSREDYHEYIRKVIEPKRQQPLSGAALETLTIIAYNQPITRSRVDFIRGVDSAGSVYRLLERGLIEEVGRLEAPGRPILYGTTLEFLRVFGLKSLDDLPKPEELVQKENFLE